MEGIFTHFGGIRFSHEPCIRFVSTFDFFPYKGGRFVQADFISEESSDPLA